MVQVTSEEIETGESESLVRLRLLPSNARLVDARKKLGLTQVEFAKFAGVSMPRLSCIETLKIIPTLNEICKIACALEKPTDYIFPEHLLSAVEVGVFSQRKKELAAPQVIALTEVMQRSLLSDGGIQSVEDEVDRKLLTEQVADVLLTLKPREQRVLALRFGLGGEAPLTLEAVGRKPEFRVSQNRIRQIEQKALRRLRHPSRSRKLKGYLD